jgi:transcriptional regulator with XRE-family HTH domain
MSQRDFAEAIHISQPSYTQYESGIRPPRDVTISQICTTFNVREEWLRDGTGEMFNQLNPTLIDGLVQEYDLGEYGRSMLEAFVTLPKEQRDNFLNFVHEFAENYRQHSAEEEKDTPAVPGRFAAAEIKKPPTRNA